MKKNAEDSSSVRERFYDCETKLNWSQRAFSWARENNEDISFSLISRKWYPPRIFSVKTESADRNCLDPFQSFVLQDPETLIPPLIAIHAILDFVSPPSPPRLDGLCHLPLFATVAIAIAISHLPQLYSFPHREGALCVCGFFHRVVFTVARLMQTQLRAGIIARGVYPLHPPFNPIDGTTPRLRALH